MESSKIVFQKYIMVSKLGRANSYRLSQLGFLDHRSENSRFVTGASKNSKSTRKPADSIYISDVQLIHPEKSSTYTLFIKREFEGKILKMISKFCNEKI